MGEKMMSPGIRLTQKLYTWSNIGVNYLEPVALKPLYSYHLALLFCKVRDIKSQFLILFERDNKMAILQELRHFVPLFPTDYFPCYP